MIEHQSYAASNADTSELYLKIRVCGESRKSKVDGFRRDPYNLLNQ